MLSLFSDAFRRSCQMISTKSRQHYENSSHADDSVTPCVPRRQQVIQEAATILNSFGRHELQKIAQLAICRPMWQRCHSGAWNGSTTKRARIDAAAAMPAAATLGRSLGRSVGRSCSSQRGVVRRRAAAGADGRRGCSGWAWAVAQLGVASVGPFCFAWRRHSRISYNCLPVSH